MIPRAEDRPLLSVGEAAQVLGVSRSTAYEMARAGAMPVLRLSARRIAVPTAALRSWLGLDGAGGPSGGGPHLRVVDTATPG